jgi:hypothetical protein
MPSDIDSDVSSDLSELDTAQFNEDLIIEDTPNGDNSTSSSQPPGIRDLWDRRYRQQRCKRKKETWTYSRARLPYEPSKDSHGHAWFYCKFCSWRGVISNATTHLKKHGICAQERQTERQIREQRTIDASFSKAEKESHSKADEHTKNVLSNAINKESYRNAVTRLITANSLSHKIIESPEWTAMCLTINWCARPALISSHTTVKERIAFNFQYQKELIKQHLHQAISCIHFCTDTWYAGTTFQKEFQAFNAQFVDKQGHLRKALLALSDLPAGHSGEAVAPFFIDVLQWYDIEDKLGCITGDNHGANDVLCRALEEHLRTERGIANWHAEHQRLRCIGHIINLPVQTFLFAKDHEAVEVAKQRVANSTTTLDEALYELSQTEEKAGWSRAAPVYKLYRLAVALRSMRFAKEFKHLAGKVLHMPNETRWNSWYRLIEEALQTRATVVSIIDAHEEIQHLQFTNDDWQLLRDTYYFLQPFYSATLLCEGDVTMDRLQDAMDMLSDHYKEQEAKHTTNEYLLAAINTSWHHFNEYYELIDNNPYYIAAQLLHPSKRLSHLKKKRWPAKWRKDAEARARALWHQYKERYQPEGVESGSTGLIAIEPDFFERWRRRNDIQPLEDDFTAFINAYPTKLGAGHTALNWWSSEEQRQAYPALSKMAIDCLSAFPMSAESERVFSRVRRTVDWQRASLGSDTIEQSECSKDWQVSGLAYAPIDTNLAALDSQEYDMRPMCSPPSRPPPPPS